MLRNAKEADTPKAVPPVEEMYAAHNNPYRGTEDHGVEKYDVYDPTSEALDWDEKDPGDTLVEDRGVAAVPVYVVESGPREVKRWRTAQFNVGDVPVQLIGEQAERTKVTITNLSESTLAYVSSEQYAATPIGGYPVSSLQASVEIKSDSALYASCASGENATLALLIEFNAVVKDG